MITLSTAAIETTTVGGSTVDAANIAIAGSAITDFQNQIITLTLPLGAGAGAAFVGSRYAASAQLSINIAAATYSYGAVTGAIPSALLAQIVSTVKNYRNGLEYLAQQSGVTPGVITQW